MKLGDKVKDIVTGLTGVITVRSEFLSGCVRYGIQPAIDKDGKMPDSVYFDENQLEMVQENSVVRAKGPNGGPERQPRSNR